MNRKKALVKQGHKAQTYLSRELRKKGLYSGVGNLKKTKIPEFFADMPLINGKTYESHYSNINHKLLDIVARLNNKRYSPGVNDYEISSKTNIVKAKIKTSIDPASAAFLQTYEWRKLRINALMVNGRKCQCCGNTPKNGAILHVDHIKPRKRYPELALDIDNLQILCSECNHGKGNWCETDFR